MLPSLYAHRLGRAYGPDNSLSALATAIRRPLDGVETDVCLTSDGELVLLHDPLLPLCTNLEGWAHQRTAAEIRGAALLTDQGEPTADSPILLEELLDAAPAELVVQLDVKAHADSRLAARTAAAVCERCRGRGVRERVEVISFHASACEVAAARGFCSRLVVFADYAPEALASWAVHHMVHGVSVEHFLLGERLVETLREAGLSVNTGTVNDPRLLERALRFNPDAVCTDRPHELRAEALASGLEAAAHRSPQKAA